MPCIFNLELLCYLYKTGLKCDIFKKVIDHLSDTGVLRVRAYTQDW